MDIPETFSGIGLQVPGVPLLRISILDTRLEQRPGSAGGAAWWLWLPMKVTQMFRAVYFVEDKWQNATYQKFCVEGIRKELWKV